MTTDKSDAEITRALKAALRKQFPSCKFSVTRLARIKKVYVEADEMEDATYETCLRAVWDAVPDATREEIAVVLAEHITELNEKAERLRRILRR